MTSVNITNWSRVPVYTVSNVLALSIQCDKVKKNCKLF